MKKHLIKHVADKSIAGDAGIVPGDFLISINGKEIEDVFDYRYFIMDTGLTLRIEKQDGAIKEYYVNKSEDEDLGLGFESGLMGQYRSCCNKCIFCFIDQLPEGMRQTLYFKDDDMRLSFLQGNYVTLTNLSDNDISRIIKYKLEPVNISFHTTNPELRVRMLNNRFAGDALSKADKLYENNITMNGQIVLCKGINDGNELDRTLSDLYMLLPVLQSLSIVPAGLTKYRDNLYPLEAFNKDDAVKLIETVNKWQNKAYKEYGIHYVHASDEWYIMAEKELPAEDKYDGYLQIENGVGMIRSLTAEFNDGINKLEEALKFYSANKHFTGIFHKTEKYILKAYGIENVKSLMKSIRAGREVSIVTGMAAYKYISELADRFCEKFNNFKINVYPIKNDFFGENITVTGLLTGRDIIAGLKDKEIGDVLLISENMLRANTRVLLDDVTLDEIEKSLHSRTCIVKSNGRHLIESIIGVNFYV